MEVVYLRTSLYIVAFLKDRRAQRKQGGKEKEVDLKINLYCSVLRARVLFYESITEPLIISWHVFMKSFLLAKIFRLIRFFQNFSIPLYPIFSTVQVFEESGKAPGC